MASRVHTYPVLWSEAGCEPATGRVTTGPEALELEGSRGGVAVRRMLPYRNLEGVRIGRTPPDVLDGKPTLVVEQADGSPVLVRPLGPGVLFELADLVAELCAREEPPAQIAVVCPLRPGAAARARELVAEGPPFDPADKSLERHEVFLSESEAIFVFTGEDACDSIRRIMSDSSVWETADHWSECLDGPPRLAEAAYAWPTPG